MFSCWLPKKKKGIFDCTTVPECNVVAERLPPGFLRGGGTSKSDRLLAGLKDVLAAVEKAEEPADEHVDDSDALFSCLQRLVNERPTNLLQELRSLVTRFSKKAMVKERWEPATECRAKTTLSPRSLAKASARAKAPILARGPQAKAKAKVLLLCLWSLIKTKENVQVAWLRLLLYMTLQMKIPLGSLLLEKGMSKRQSLSPLTLEDPEEVIGQGMWQLPLKI